jgi:hypothetical protein
MNGMVERCMDSMGSMGSMMGGGMMGSGMMGSGMMLFVLLVVLLIWMFGLVAVGALIFWGVRRLSRTSSANG